MEPLFKRIPISQRKKFIRPKLIDIEEDQIVFYDIETTHQYAPYCEIKMIAAQYGINGEVDLVDTPRKRERFKKAMASDIIKVAFNNKNFDDIVLNLHGIVVNPQNSHDVYLMLKTISPNLPAYSLKFAAFYFLGDPHFPEMEMSAYMAEHRCQMYEVPHELLARYNKHDVNPQTRDLFRMAWEVVIRDEHWQPYLEDLLMGEPLYEMETEGGMYLNAEEIWRRLHALQKQVQVWTNEALVLTKGQVNNANSSKQLGEYLSGVDNVELELTESGEFCVKKSVLVDLKDTNPLANIAYKIRGANGTLKYYENYLKALDDSRYHKTRGENWIPVQFSISSARTRRFTSQSLHKLNFQNPNEKAKEVQIVPDGFLGVWIDATQIENVVHIYESQDVERRRAYEADPDWNEYVWLCNQIIGGGHTKEELDAKDPKTHQPTDFSRSKQIPHWTVYKQYKTGKLGLNFGMGNKKFCKLFGLKEDVGRTTFNDIHGACPAIRELQARVANELRRNGFVTDSFGKRYAGPPNLSYKVVAYKIQGCGTGSLPKAQIRANWESLRRYDGKMPERLRRKETKCGVMCGTTHDENSLRVDLRLGEEPILQLLQKLMYNMTAKFSPKFDNIPLRAKMYLSRTTAAEAKEIDITNHKQICELLH